MAVIIRDEKNEKDPHHMALLMYCEEQPQVTEFDPETAFGQSTDKKVRIPNIDCLFSKDCLAMVLYEVEYIEEEKTVGVISLRWRGKDRKSFSSPTY